MSHITIQVDTDNEAFWIDPGAGGKINEPGPEMARILRELANQIEGGIMDEKIALHDANGNHVGTMETHLDANRLYY